MKYAIFKGEIGLYSWRYIDNPGELKNYPYIDEDSLPVVVNSRGGYHSFDPKYEKNFLEIREAPLAREDRYPKNSPNFEYGWIDPDGNTYNTGYEGHYRCAACLFEEWGLDTLFPERKLEEMGYVKITRLFGEKKVFAEDLFITKKQADALFDLGLYDLDDVKVLLYYSESKW